jgi:hypothetical protein
MRERRAPRVSEKHQLPGSDPPDRASAMRVRPFALDSAHGHAKMIRDFGH